MVVVALIGATAASAYWPASGTGSTTAAVATLAPPTNVTVPANSTPNVAISWTASAGTTAPAGYYVTRITGSTSMPACGSSPTALVTGTSCTDSAAPEGTHTYVVTAVHRSWTATSAPSGNVLVWSMQSAAFTVQPANVVAGQALSVVKVAIRTVDLMPVISARVTLAIGNNPGGGTLSGTVTADTDWTGVATFSGLSINKAGTGYTLAASSPGVAGAVSTPFTVTAAAATHLVVTGPASGIASATATVGPFTVERQDAYGNPVTAGSTDVTLASNSAGAKIFAATSGGASVTKVTIPAGSASASYFYGDTRAGTARIMLGSSLTASPVDVAITAAAAAKLSFGQQPTNTAKGQRITPVTVRVEDQFGNLQTTSVASVTMDKTNKQGNLGGTVVQGAVGGVATFSDLTINPAGVHTLIATSPGLGSVTSAEFTSGG